MRELMERLVQALVDEPGAVEVRQLQAGSVTILEVHVASPDIGKVIGKSGATAAALRTLLWAAAGRVKACRGAAKGFSLVENLNLKRRSQP